MKQGSVQLTTHATPARLTVGSALIAVDASAACSTVRPAARTPTA